MSDYVGKHLLVDCYGCKREILLSSAEILNTMSDSAVHLGLMWKILISMMVKKKSRYLPMVHDHIFVFMPIRIWDMWQ